MAPKNDTTENKLKDGWHLEKNVGVGHLLTTLLAVISLVTWLTTMDKRVAVLEGEMLHAQAADIHLEAQFRDSLARIDSTLVRIETKLDNKEDKQNGRR